MMQTTITFAPIIPLPFILGLGALALALLVYGFWRGLPGWFFRTIALGALVAALLNPMWREEDRQGQSDVAIIVVDDSSSQTISDRPAQTANALAKITAAMQDLGGSIDIETVHVADAGSDGTLLLGALGEAMGRVSASRLAGAFLITDGQAHDADTLANFPAPVHQLLTGEPHDWDRRMVIATAPAFGIVGESVEIVVRIEDLGAVPNTGGSAQVIASIDGGEEQVFTLPLDEDIPLTLTIDHGGINLLEIRTPPVFGEITEANDRAILSVNGVRDRLRVLLISGEPYQGERTWRNLLKADASVDLVHFTILRPPNKQDGVPYEELSLIAFPTQELFMDKIDDFDLIIFDRFRQQGVLPRPYLQNVVRYVNDGGAVLIASGPSFADVESLYRTPLRDILPAAPTGRIIEQGFTPALSEVGRRHPVTEGLAGLSDGWGRWMRMVETVPVSGHTLMRGLDGLPLLQLARVGRGRIAQLTSDQAWLWTRGFEGGGPQRELLRRVAHWLMKEPELEENVLRATALGMDVTVERQMLDGETGPVTVTSPSGVEQVLTLQKVTDGRWRAGFVADESGVYRLTEGDRVAVVATGPTTPIEFRNPIATADLLAPLVQASGGSSFRLFDGVPSLRQVRAGRVAAGRGWAGLVRRDAYLVQNVRQSAVAPGWAYLLIAALFALIGWRIEGR